MVRNKKISAFPGKEKNSGLRMKNLVEATGVPKSTILHYLNEGLLPPPRKTSRNMAYYDPVCVERLSFIKLMQKKYRLPLEEIKEFFRRPQNDRELMALMELNVAIFGRQDEGKMLDQEAFCRVTGLVPREVEELMAAGVLQPLQNDSFDQEDVTVGRLLRGSFGLGLTPTDCAFYHRLAEEIVTQEMELRQRLTSHLPLEQNAILTLELTRAARALRAYVIDRVFQHRVMAMKGLKDRGDLPTNGQ